MFWLKQLLSRSRWLARILVEYHPKFVECTEWANKESNNVISNNWFCYCTRRISYSSLHRIIHIFRSCFSPLVGDICCFWRSWETDEQGLQCRQSFYASCKSCCWYLPHRCCFSLRMGCVLYVGSIWRAITICRYLVVLQLYHSICQYHHVNCIIFIYLYACRVWRCSCPIGQWCSPQHAAKLSVDKNTITNSLHQLSYHWFMAKLFRYSYGLLRCIHWYYNWHDANEND